MDIYLTDIGDGGDFRFNNGDLATDDGFATAIYISLFGGDQPSGIFLEIPDRTDNEFQDALKDVITMDNLRKIESKGNKALAWMIEDTVVSEIQIVATSPELNYIKIEITLIQPTTENKYTIYWDREKAGVARIVTN